MTRINFTGPSEAVPRNPTDTANRDTLEAAPLTLPGTAITMTPKRSVLFSPVLTTADTCTPEVLFDVPLRQLRSGAFRTKLLASRYVVYPNANLLRSDRDSLRLRCTP